MKKLLLVPLMALGLTLFAGQSEVQAQEIVMPAPVMTEAAQPVFSPELYTYALLNDYFTVDLNLYGKELEQLYQEFSKEVGISLNDHQKNQMNYLISRLTANISYEVKGAQAVAPGHFTVDVRINPTSFANFEDSLMFYLENVMLPYLHMNPQASDQELMNIAVQGVLDMLVVSVDNPAYGTPVDLKLNLILDPATQTFMIPDWEYDAIDMSVFVLPDFVM